MAWPIHSAMLATLTLSTIAAPPPCGVGRWCELRSFGTSRTPRASAILRTTPVSNAVASPAAKAIAAITRESWTLIGRTRARSVDERERVGSGHRRLPCEDLAESRAIDDQRSDQAVDRA